MGRVSIDTDTCCSPGTTARLRLLSLTDPQRHRVRETLLEMASTQHEEFAAKMKSKGKHRHDAAASSGAYALQQLSTFCDWVADRNFTVIIAGPNVAYFGHPVLHYSQVARMVEYLESLGERPLVTMPYKYCQRSFYVASISQEQKLSDRDVDLITVLKAREQLYEVP